MNPTYNDLLNNLYYFYSTAPQVLGAILAITGAYVVFRLDGLSNGIFSTLEEFIEFGSSRTEELDVSQYNTFVAVIGDDYNALKYAHIAKSPSRLKEIISPKMKKISRGIQQAKEANDLTRLDCYQAIKETADNMLKQITFLASFKLQTRNIYIINGSLLGVLLIGFILTPFMKESWWSYWLFLGFGLLISLTSLFLIIRYLILTLL